jgi:small neutral amino acid transporter SnatA (MarC family)
MINELLFAVGLVITGGIIYFFFSLTALEEKKDENNLDK